MNSKVSVIIPVFNREKIIVKTLDSIKNQSYQNLECIIVDDGSQDKSVAIIKDYIENNNDDRFKFYKRPINRLGGGNAARNYGFEKSSGDYINYLDSDDHLHFETLKIKLHIAKKYKADVVISGHTRNYEDLLKGSDNPRIFNSSTFDRDFIKMRNDVLIGDPMFKSSLMNRVKFDENLKRGQDHDFFIRLFRNKNKYAVITLKLYYYRLTPNSITVKAGTGNREMINTQISIHKKMQQYYKEDSSVVFEYERKTRRMYKRLILKNQFLVVLDNYHFYRKSYHLSQLEFLFFFIYNFLLKRGFDQMKKNLK